MRVVKYIMLLVFFIATPISAQVDTLQLVEIGSITAPSEIVDLYIEDLDADSLKEIILTTATNVHIYNGITYERIWSGPYMVHPEDLIFYDINNDGLTDISVRENNYIYFLDPHTPSIIWTSPNLSGDFKCYTIGDKGLDEISVMAMVNEIPNNIPDSASYQISLSCYPDFTPTDSILFNLLHDDTSTSYWEVDIPKSIYFETLGDSSDYSYVIAFHTYYDKINNSSGSNSWVDNGDIHVIDSYSYEILYSFSSGRLRAMLQYSDDNLGNSIFYLGWSGGGMGAPYPTSSGGFTFTRLSANGANELLDTDCFYPNNPKVFINELLESESGPELCYYYGCEFGNPFALFSTDQMDYIWFNYITNFGSLIEYSYHNNIYENPMIVERRSDCLRVHNPADGTIIAETENIVNLDFRIYDINNDGNDELLGYESEHLYFYNIAMLTSLENEISIPQNFTHQSYPNPFNSNCTIEYSLPEAGQVAIEIYDILGRKIETLINKEMQAGSHSISWNASAQSSGIYFYRVTAGEYSDTRKMVYLK